MHQKTHLLKVGFLLQRRYRLEIVQAGQASDFQRCASAGVWFTLSGFNYTSRTGSAGNLRQAGDRHAAAAEVGQCGIPAQRTAVAIAESESQSAPGSFLNVARNVVRGRRWKLAVLQQQGR